MLVIPVDVNIILLIEAMEPENVSFRSLCLFQVFVPLTPPLASQLFSEEPEGL